MPNSEETSAINQSADTLNKSIKENLFIYKDKEKSHLLNCKCDTFVNITSPTQLQDGTTYDSSNIIHHICMKSNKKLFR